MTSTPSKLPTRARLGAIFARGAPIAGAIFVLLLLGEWVWDGLDPFRRETLTKFGASTEFVSSEGVSLRVTSTDAGERLLPVPLQEFSPHLVSALLAAEDRRFFHHSGVDVRAAARALLTNTLAQRTVSGASTITMQLARILEPRKRSLGAKLLEMRRARQIEASLSKSEILEAYLNLVPLGGTLRGMEAGSRVWFGKRARDLAPEEAATLVALLPAPSHRVRHRAQWEHARNDILRRMASLRELSPTELDRALETPLAASREPFPFLAPHALDAIPLERGGGIVRTTVHVLLQERLRHVVETFDTAGVSGVAVVIADIPDGNVRALVGSFDYRRAPLNAAHSRRCAGSTLKPFLYALALDCGALGPHALVTDTPLTYRDYRPENFSHDFAGPLDASTALTSSRNTPAVRLLEAVGPARFRDLLRHLGFAEAARALHLDAALGTLPVSPLELAQAYARFAGPDPVGDLPSAPRQQVLAWLREDAPKGSTLPPGLLAWKTGTSSNRRDAWCVGITPSHVISVWLGRLDDRPAPDLVGRRAAIPLLLAVLPIL